MLISLYLPNMTEPATEVSARQAQVLMGNKTLWDDPEPKRGFGLRSAYWLAGVEVFATNDSKAILIVDDDAAIRDRNGRDAGWLEPFKERLLTQSGARYFAILNSSVSYCAITRQCNTTIFQRIEDAQRNQRGVKWIILSAGYQDILTNPYPDLAGVSAEDLIRKQKAIADAVHAAGLKIYGVTYPPFTLTDGVTVDREALRAAVNTWIRESGTFDAVADFDLALRNPSVPSQLQDVFRWKPETAAPIVLSDIAFRAMAESFDLSVF